MGDLCCTVGNTDILGNNCVMYMVALCITARKRTPELRSHSLVVHLPSHTKGPMLSPAEHEAQTS